MSTKKTFESFLNSMNENMDLYKIYKRVSGKYSLRKPSYWGDLFNQRASIPYKELEKYSSELDSLEVYTTKELGCHADYPMQSNFKVQVPQVFVLYCNTERGELGEYYGMSILVNTEGATYPRYAAGMPDFEPELHNFANGIPESYLNIVTTGAQMLHEKMITEGQFSWMTQDTGDQIGSEPQNKIDVYMYDNQGNSWKERDYEGYGEFGGMDYYDLVATMNGYTEEDVKTMKGSFKELRQLGIDLAFGKIKTKDKKRKTLFPALVTDPRYNWKRHDFTQEAESDPNQSWYQEPEFDDYEDEDDYYESTVTENYEVIYSDGVSAMKKFRNEKQALDFMKKTIASNKKLKNIAVYKPGMYSTTQTELVVAFWGDGSYLDNVSKRDKDLAAKKLEESVVNEDVFGDLEAAISDMDFDAYQNLAFEFGIDAEDANQMTDFIYNELDKKGAKLLIKNINKGVYESSGLNEGRSINKISKEFGETVANMKDLVKVYVAAEEGSDEKAKLKQQLIDLTAKKKALTNELDDAVAGKNKDVKLVITEGVMSNIHLMASDSKNWDDFLKKFKKDYKKVFQNTPDFMDWLYGMYKDMAPLKAGEKVEESKIQIKRRYTENHPAKTAGRMARVRNAMIEALADGVLTEEEFNNILKEKSIDNKRWMRRNSKYFTVSENGIGLSKFGKRILDGIKPAVSLTLESFLNESTVKFKGKKVDISSIEIEDVDMRDYPDFSDAFVSYAEYTNGKELSDRELEDFMDEYPDLVHELAHESLH